MNNVLGIRFPELADEITSYIILIGIFYTCVWMLGAIFIMCRESMSPQAGVLYCFRRIGRLGLFLLVLLLVGDFYGVIWSTLIHNHMYHSPGYDGIDFVPWYPVTRSLVEATYGSDTGRLMGVTLLQLQIIWLVFAIATWTSTMVVYDKISIPEEMRCRRRIGSSG